MEGLRRIAKVKRLGRGVAVRRFWLCCVDTFESPLHLSHL